jgi:hypothetical protein
MVNREGLYSIHNYEDVLDELNKGMQLIIIPERDVLTLKIILDEYKNKVDDEEIFETFNFTSTDIKEWNTIKEIPWGKITADERGARERKIVLDKLKNDKGAKKNFPDVILAVNER